eukprot:1153064-Pelagomonas_calceolata.AAC.4
MSWSQCQQAWLQRYIVDNYTLPNVEFMHIQGRCSRVLIEPRQSEASILEVLHLGGACGRKHELIHVKGCLCVCGGVWGQ